MSTKFNIDIALKGHDEGAGSLLEQTALRIKAVNKEARASGELSLERMLKRGPEGLLQAVGGGVAGVGIALGAQALDRMGETMQELRKEFVEGKGDAGEMIDKIAEGVPLFGEVWKAGRAINEGLTGEKYAIELINEEAKITNSLFEAQTHKVELMRTTMLGYAEAARAATAHAAAMETRNPGEKAAIEEKEQLTEAKEKSDTELRDKLAAQEKAARELREANDKEVENLRKQFKNEHGYSPDDIRATSKRRSVKDFMGREMANEKVGAEERADRAAIDAAEKTRTENAARAVQDRQTLQDEGAKAALAAQKSIQGDFDSAYREQRDSQQKEENKARDDRMEKAKQEDEVKLRKSEAASNAQSEGLAKAFEVEGNLQGAALERLREHYRERIDLAGDNTREVQGLMAQRRADEEKLLQDGTRQTQQIEGNTHAMEVARKESHNELLLRSQGKFREADLAAAKAHTDAAVDAINREYAEKIRAAASGEEKMALTKQQKAALAAARDQGAQDTAAAEIAAIHRQFGGGGRGVSATLLSGSFRGVAESQRAQNYAQEQTQLLGAIARHLAKIAGEDGAVDTSRVATLRRGR